MPERRSVLVTGGTGFLGRRLVERLLGEGRTVAVLARRPAPDLEARGVRMRLAPIDDVAAVHAACAGVETVFHVAAKVGVWGRRDAFFRANVLGTRAVIEGCRRHGVSRLIHTSTPSVVYNGRDLAGADESLPLTADCPSPYPVTKAEAERDVLAANDSSLRTVALRPHLIWGAGDPHLMPRILERARAGRLRIVGDGGNRVDLTHVDHAVEAHLLAEAALDRCAGKAYFLSDGAPVVLWDWINGVLQAVGLPPVTKRISLGAATAAGGLCEALWRILPLRSDPPTTRFIAAELAKDHWFDISAARRDLGYAPAPDLSSRMTELIDSLK